MPIMKNAGVLAATYATAAKFVARTAAFAVRVFALAVTL